MDGMQNNLFIVSVDNPVDYNTVHTTDICLDLFVLSAKNNHVNVKYISNPKEEIQSFVGKSPRPMVLAKLYAQKKFILQNVFEDDDLILFVDSYDIIFNGGSDQFINAFYQYKTEILVGAEKNAWPEENKIFSKDNHLGKNRYPNSGCIIGKYKMYKKIFEENDIANEIDDQIFWGKIYFKYRNENLIKIDHLSKLVQNDLYDVFNQDYFSSPILHANGYNQKISKRDCLQKVYKKTNDHFKAKILNIPVFLINLESRKDRLVNSLRVWGKLGVCPKLIKAVNSDQVNLIMSHIYPNTNLDYFYKSDAWRKNKKDKDILSAITFSHLAAFKEAKDMGLDRVIVAQDDLMIHKDIANVIKNFDNINYDAIQFECLESSETTDLNKFSAWPYHALLTKDCYKNGSMLESAILHTKNSFNYFIDEHFKMQKNEIPFDVTEVIALKRQFLTKKWYTHFPFCVLQKNEDSEQFSNSNPDHLKGLRTITEKYLNKFHEDYYI